LIAREASLVSGKLDPTPPQNSFMPAPVPVDFDDHADVWIGPRWNCSSARLS
jgi:hypothetical protein